MSYTPYNEPEKTKSNFPITPSKISYLGYNTNNQYPEFPPLMMDGRAIISSYQPESAMNNDIIMQNNITTNWQYRQYLMNNAEQIMQQNFTDACNDSGSSTKLYEIHSDANVIKDPLSSPFVYSETNQSDKPFGHSNSDLKTNYLSREDLTAKKNVQMTMSP